MPQRLWKILGAIMALFGIVLAYDLNTHQFAAWPWSNAIDVHTVYPPLDSVVDDASTTIRQTSSNISASASSTSSVQMNALVVRVVDGDTLVVKYDGQSNEERVRMLGINTPEVVDPRKTVECFGKEASAHMHQLVDGKRIRLDEDLQADNVDKYGRLLRNVILSDGTDVNAVMVRDGYAYAYLSFPLNAARKQELKKLENDARMAGRGLWSLTTCNGLK